ncbi:high-affinity branched-chain amino acid ABC transporter ATP-binding protein LivG [Candidatus Atribacteria bacterium HGW-Atribacteria-1]|nr:MAG: high-affinity branched-chain amino acid ABC transporter ATP-binding protein LivG [Candidatus Atribacteria bacterium HGW-Atribacteria-1]
MSILKADHITIRFGGLTAVSDFYLNLEEGELVGLIGPNGAGKTTVFNMLTGVYKPIKGGIYFNGQEITRKRIDKITALGIARTFQNIRLFTNLSVIDNVMVGCHLRIKSSVLNAIFYLPQYLQEENYMKEEARQLLKEVNLEKLETNLAGGLPYGEQRKLEIARALATRPKLLLLDEPAAGMNPHETKDLMSFIQRIQEKFKLTIVLIEHDMKVVMGICKRILVLDYGITIAEGNPVEIQHNPEVIKAYLGVEAHYA